MCHYDDEECEIQCQGPMTSFIVAGKQLLNTESSEVRALVEGFWGLVHTDMECD